MGHLRIGSRGSQLALWQAKHVAGLLQAQGHSIEIQVIKTTGDKITDVALSKVGAKGMFTKEIEEALAAGQVDLAVHSLKDVPTELQPEFELAAIMKRGDPRDAFISVNFCHLDELPQEARVGTSSLRRQCQLKSLRPDLEVIPLRGNVDTRLRKLESGEYDAIILASAGLNRLGLDRHMRYRIEAEQMCPAAGQGALAIETRRHDQQTRGMLEFLDHAETRAAVTAERTVMRLLGGGCRLPVGAHAFFEGSTLHMRAVVASPDGTKVIEVSDQAASNQASTPEELGRRVSNALLEQGADRILDAL